MSAERRVTNREEFAGRSGERLRERVIEEIFPRLAAGFMHEASAGEAADESLESVFQGTLVLLYRLLFLFCAEARGLLPAGEEQGYDGISLTRLKREIAARAGELAREAEAGLRKRYREDSYRLYKRLTKLFRTIDKGDAALSVHAYRGSLFHSGARGASDGTVLAQASQFLRTHRIPDRHLARALDMLARETKANSESLVFIDYSTLDVRWLGSIYEGLLERRLRGKELLYLEKDRRERKATGSYYTPDYIVRHIIEQTIGPILEEKFRSLGPRLRQVAKRREDKTRLFDELFDLKVLDPACGPGHFLVEAVDYIAARMLVFLKTFERNPVTAQLAHLRKTFAREMRASGHTIDLKQVTDFSLLKRHVLRRCVYGVDVNPMAVELAKLSLWLDCFTRGAPLPFLDQHLRCGDALIGASLREALGAVEGRSLSRLLAAADLMRQASLISDLTRGEAETCRAQYRKARRAVKPLKRILDNYTGRCLNIAAQSKSKRFFHWELEFPQAISGFDAVVGNPPWGAELAQDEKRFYRERFQAVATGKVDSFALFIERCTKATRLGGRMGLLLPDIILLKNYPAARLFILSNQQISQIVHWGQPFADVSLDVCSIVSARSESVADDVPLSCLVKVASRKAQEFVRNTLTHGIFRHNEAYKFNLFLNDELRKALAVVEENSEALSDFLEFHEGIHSGNVRGKLFVDECASAECQRLIFGGDEVQPFTLRWKGRHVVYDRSIINKSKGEYANLGREPHFVNPKLLVRRTGDRIIAATDYDHFFASNNLFVARARSGVTIPLEFFEGLLNSDFSTWYFRAIQPRQGRLFSELKIVHLLTVPVPRKALTEHLAEIVSLVKSLRGGVNLRRGGEAPGQTTAYAKLNRIFASCAGLREGSGGAS